MRRTTTENRKRWTMNRPSADPMVEITAAVVDFKRALKYNPAPIRNAAYATIANSPLII
jgi:hypothetical protein